MTNRHTSSSSVRQVTLVTSTTPGRMHTQLPFPDALARRAEAICGVGLRTLLVPGRNREHKAKMLPCTLEARKP